MICVYIVENQKKENNMIKKFPKADIKETRRVVDLAEDLLLELDTVFNMENQDVKELYDTLVDLCRTYPPTHVPLND